MQKTEMMMLHHHSGPFWMQLEHCVGAHIGIII